MFDTIKLLGRCRRGGPTKGSHVLYDTRCYVVTWRIRLPLIGNLIWGRKEQHELG